MNRTYCVEIRRNYDNGKWQYKLPYSLLYVEVDCELNDLASKILTDINYKIKTENNFRKDNGLSEFIEFDKVEFYQYDGSPICI